MNEEIFGIDNFNLISDNQYYIEVKYHYRRIGIIQKVLIFIKGPIASLFLQMLMYQ